MENKQMKKMYVVIFSIALLSTILLICLLYSKEGMHVDEYLTYGLANYQKEGYMLDPEFGVRLSAAEVFDDYFYTDNFNIKNVWINQGNNVHPPLYYLFFHIFVLVTQHFLGLKTGALLNIIFHIINICLIWLVMHNIIRKDYMALLGTILYAFMPVIVESVLFTRMYVLLSTFVLALTLLFVKEWNGERRKKFYLTLFLISICGTLTHYYFLIYLFFCCLVWGIRILKKHNWKELSAFLLTMTAAGFSCLLIFPYTLKQVFKGNGGKRTYESLFSFSFLENGKAFLKTINNVYGGFLLAVVIFVIILFVFKCIYATADKKEKRDIGPWAVIVIPCVLFFIIVTKIAIMPGIRYISPIYGICIIMLAGLSESLLSCVTAREEIKCFAGILLTGVLLNSGWQLYDWPGLHKEAKQYVEEAESYGVNNECICIMTSSWRSLPNYQEFVKYQNITFIPFDHLELLFREEYAEYDHVVLYIDEKLGEEEIENILQNMIDINPGLDRYEKMHRYSYNVTYYLD